MYPTSVPDEGPKPKLSDEETEALKKQIAEMEVLVKKGIDDIDNNFNLAGLKLREKKREVNKLQS